MPAPGSPLMPVTPVFLVDLFPELHAELMSLLRSLRREDWGQPTACALWSVKDIVAHLLDSALRRLSFGRDRMEPVPDQADHELCRPGRIPQSVECRVGPSGAAAEPPGPHRSAGPHRAGALGLLPDARSPRPGTIRGGLGRRGDVAQLVRYRPGVHRAMAAPAADQGGGRSPPLTSRNGFTRPWTSSFGPCPSPIVRSTRRWAASVRIEIQGEAGGTWTLKRTPDGWRLFTGGEASPATRVTLSQDVAWKLFSKGLSPETGEANHQAGGRHPPGPSRCSAALAIMA